MKAGSKGEMRGSGREWGQMGSGGGIGELGGRRGP